MIGEIEKEKEEGRVMEKEMLEERMNIREKKRRNLRERNGKRERDATDKKGRNIVK